MSRHEGPEFTVPDGQRCEALVVGQSGWAFTWQKVNHRCPNRANQCRQGRPVCHSHAMTKKLRFWEESE